MIYQKLNNMLINLIIVVVLIGLAYWSGYHKGHSTTIQSTLDIGSWVEITDKIIVKMGNNPASILQPGTEAIVTGKDKWGRISIWIAKPWAHLYDGSGSKGVKFSGIESFTKLKIKPTNRIDKKIYEETLQALTEYEEIVGSLLSNMGLR